MAKAQIIRIPTARHGGGRGRALFKRGVSAAARAAAQERHTIVAVGAAATLGMLKRTGVGLPHIGALGTAGTYGIGAWLIGRFMRSRILEHVATGLLCVAAHSLAAGGGMAGDDDGDMSGQIDVSDAA